MSEIHENVLEAFLMYAPELVSAMKQCDHGLNISHPNPYHMEGDVWTHTLLAYNSLVFMDEFMELSERCQIIVCLAVLCHDIGKPFTKQILYNHKCLFAGHEKRSFQESVNLSEIFDRVYNLDLAEVYSIFLLISAHSVYWQSSSPQDVYPYLNYDESLLELYKMVTLADRCGQIRSTTINDGKEESNLYDFEFDLTEPEDRVYDQEIILMAGIPGVGKDTVISKITSIDDYVVVSYDDIRLTIYRNSIVDSAAPQFPDLPQPESKGEEYRNAWEYCNRTKVNLNELMFEQINEALDSNKNVIISNTNCPVKTRKKLIEKIRSDVKQEVGIVIMWVFASLEESVNRDEDRAKEDKTVSADVVMRMFYNQELPTFNEDADDIYLCYNPDYSEVESYDLSKTCVEVELLDE